MSRKILGLDIRRNSLSAVLVSGTLQGNQVEGVCYFSIDSVIDKSVELPEEDSDRDENLVSSGHKPEDRGELLLKMLEAVSGKLDIAGASCIVSFPADDISYRNLVVPFRNKKKIKQVLPFELEPVMPGLVDELIVDFQVVNLPAGDEEASLISASVNSGLLESFESCLKKGGVLAQAIVPGGSAVADYMIRTLETNNDYLFADINEEACTLFIIREKQVCSIRSFNAGKDTGKIIGQTINRTVLAFCEQYDLDYQPEMLVVTGCELKTPGFGADLTLATGLDLVQTDVLLNSGISIEGQMKSDWEPALYDSALSLAYSGMYGVKGLKFSERFFNAGKYFSEYKKNIISSGIILLLVMVSGLVNMIFDTYTVNKKIGNYEKQMIALYKETFPEAKRIVRPFDQLQAKVNEARKNAAFTDSNAGNIKVIELLNDISKNLPDSLVIEFDRFVLGTENLKISGTTANYATVDDMKTRLEKITYLKKVIISSTSVEKSGNQVRFKLKIEF